MKKGLLFVLPLLLSSCTSDGSSTSENSSAEPSTEPVVERERLDISNGYKVDIQDDNYRNYYEIFVSSYADSDGDGIGDLKGIAAKLDEIAYMGYTGIWLTPIFKSSSYHKYDTTDYFAIDEDFGSLDDLKELVSKAHSLNIKVILDGVFNHTAYSNVWMEKALLAKRKEIADQEMTEEEIAYSSLYTFYDTEEEAKASGKTYAKAGANNFYYECNFDRNMPEFNFDSELTYTLIESVIDYYMDESIGVDGFRLDAVKYYYLGDNAKSIQALNRIAKMVKDDDSNGYLVGECWDSNTVIKDYYTSDVDSFFYFPNSTSGGCYATSLNVEGNLRRNYSIGLQSLESDSIGGIPAPFLDNHDMARVSTNNLKTAKMRMTLFALSSGTTFSYYGDEIGMSSANVTNGDYADSNYRTHYYWDDTTHEMETYNPEHSNKQEQYFPAYYQQKEDEESLVNHVKYLNTLRNTFPFIARGKVIDNSQEDTDTINSTKLLIVTKEYQEKNYKYVLNFNPTESENYSSAGKRLASLVNKGEDEITESNGVYTLPPYSFLLLEE